MRRLLTILGRGLLGLCLLVLLYLILATALSLIPVNRGFQAPAEGVTTYIRSNGLHAEFVLPVNGAVNWTSVVATEAFPELNAAPAFIAIGWGEREFYLNTPTWKDLRLGTAVRTLFWPTPSALHITYLDRVPDSTSRARRVTLTPEQYQRLCSYVLAEFQRDATGKAILIPGAAYSSNDNFYESNSLYELINTCNTWVNGGLKKTGVRTAVWSPFEWGIFWHLN